MTQSPTRVKICGLTSPEAIKGAAQAGATYGGLVFYEKSPRHLSLAKAREVALAAPPGFAKVALVVNPQDAFLEEMLSQVPIDILQLHGAEQPQRVQQIKQSTGLPIMKALGIATAQDLREIDRYAEICDQLLIDAKPAPGAKLPGGNGLAFDWQLLEVSSECLYRHQDLQLSQLFFLPPRTCALDVQPCSLKHRQSFLIYFFLMN